MITLAEQPESFKSVLNDFLKQVHSGEIKPGQVHTGYYNQVAKHLTKAVAEGLGGSSFGADDYRNTLKAYLDQNIYAFSAARSVSMLREFRRFLTDENGEVVSFSKFKSKVADKNTIYNVAYLETEYKSAIASAQMADKWESLKQFPLLEYRTVGDDNVRDEHRLLDKLIIRSDDALVDKIYPPKDWGCRCLMVPAASNAVPTDRSKVKGYVKSLKTKPYFEKHVGKHKVLFDDDHHPYFKDLGTQKLKLGELSATKHYNMPPVSRIYEMAEDLPELKLISEKEAKTWWNDKASNSFIDLNSVDGLTWRFTDKNFKKHLFKDNKRWDIVHLLPEVVQQPDEVWCRRDNGKLYYTYLKFYDKHPIRLSYDFDRDKWTMIPVDSESSDQNLETKIRRGQLKYKSR